MRSLLFIMVVLMSCASQLRAAHILGGEITYEHLTNLEYKVWVTIYRDCSECKLAGGGGGTSTKDCGSFELFVQRSDQYSCTPTVLDRFSLTRSEIRPIVPVCSSVTTTCDTSGSGFDHGIEAHVFYTEIDFDKYSGSASCGFDLFVEFFERAGDIDNINGKDKKFYNWAFINPYEVHNTNVLLDDPVMVLPVNQAARLPLAKFNSTTDSVVYRLSSPFEEHNTPLSYTSGYTITNPITVWCDGASSPCTPDSKEEPPVGYYFNSQNGMNIFTPVKTGEKNVLVFERCTYRKVGNKMVLIGMVRRDIQVVTVQSNNNVPQFDTTARDIHVCAGETLDLDIDVTDKVFVYPDGSKADQNKVTFSWVSELSNATISSQTIASPPYSMLSVKWKTKVSDASEKPYQLLVTVEDDNCPLKGSASAIFNIYVHDLPQINTMRERLWCANVSHKASVINKVKADSFIKNWWYEGTFLGKSYQQTDTLFAWEAGSYTVATTVKSKYGCEATRNDTFETTSAHQNGFKASVDGDKTFCVGSTMELTAKTNGPTSAIISEINWYVDQKKAATGSQFFVPVDSVNQYENGIVLYVRGYDDDLPCISEYRYTPDIQSGPEIRFDEDALDSICYTSELNLVDYVNPSDGIWVAIGHGSLNGSVLDIESLDSSLLHELCQSYTVQDASNSCQTVDTLCVKVHPKPDLLMKPITICNQSGEFNMAILIERPFGVEPYHLEWTINGKPNMVTFKDEKYIVNLNDLEDGINDVELAIYNEVGCVSYGSTTLELTKNLEFIVDGISEICQGDSRHLSDIMNITPSGGIWTSIDNYDQLYVNRIDPEYCGSFSATYTYDQFGCFGTKDIFFDIRCKPSIDFNIPDSVCSSTSTVDLIATPNPGTFSGEHVVGNELLTADVIGSTRVKYELSSDGCDFNYVFDVAVIPSPRFNYPSLPENLCADDSLDLSAIRIERGWLSFSIDQDTYRFENEIDGSFVHRPSLQHIQTGVMPVNIEMVGISPCPGFTAKHNVNIRPLPEMSLPDDTIFGCTPFEFTQPFILNSEVDWNQADVIWTYHDPHSYNNVGTGVNPNHTFEQEGIFGAAVSVTTVHGCWSAFSFDSSIVVYQSPTAAFDMSPDEPVSVRLPLVRFTNKSVGEGDLTYHWDFGTYLRRDTSSAKSPTFFFVGDTATYAVTLEVTDSRGCTDFATRNVIVEQDVQLFIPNAFTPNRKGPDLNETFGVYGNNISSFEIEVVSRWGEVVYYSRDINERWDGKYLGELCPGGIYAYKVNVVSETGGVYDFTGTINVIR